MNDSSKKSSFLRKKINYLYFVQKKKKLWKKNKFN